MKKKAWILVLLAALTACSVPPKPSLKPEFSADYRSLLSLAYERLRAREFEPAREILERAITLRPDAADAYNLLGISYFLQENLRRAEEYFLRAVSLRKDYSAAYNNLGNVHFVQGNLDAAREDFRNALHISPDSAAANYSLAMLLFSQGKHEEGMTYLSRGIALEPNFLEQDRKFTAGIAQAGLTSTETYYSWAKVYALQDNPAKAVEFLQKAREAGFRNRKRLEDDKDFDKIRNNPEFQLFLQDLEPNRRLQPLSGAAAGALFF